MLRRRPVDHLRCPKLRVTRCYVEPILANLPGNVRLHKMTLECQYGRHGLDNHQASSNVKGTKNLPVYLQRYRPPHHYQNRPSISNRVTWHCSSMVGWNSIASLSAEVIRVGEMGVTRGGAWGKARAI